MSYLKWIKICLFGLSMLLASGCSRKPILLETGEQRGNETVCFAETKQESIYETEDSKALIYVYVCGQVVSPGVYELSEGDRIIHAIEMAGGILPEGDIGRLNMASLLLDGQKIYVPSFEEMETYDAEDEHESVEDFSFIGDDEEISGRLNINQATKDQLMQLAGIGVSKAEAIVQYRQEHGEFKSTEELMLVPGIKEGTYAQIKDRISIN